MKHYDYIKNQIVKNNFATERSYLGKRWWLITTLLKKAEEDGLKVYDVDLGSIDLGAMPRRVNNVLQLIDHLYDIKMCKMDYPILVAPTGWVLNGWHRAFKAIMRGDKTIKAIRFFEMPEEDGDDSEEDSDE